MTLETRVDAAEQEATAASAELARTAAEELNGERSARTLAAENRLATARENLSLARRAERTARRAR